VEDLRPVGCSMTAFVLYHHACVAQVGRVSCRDTSTRNTKDKGDTMAMVMIGTHTKSKGTKTFEFLRDGTLDGFIFWSGPCDEGSQVLLADEGASPERRKSRYRGPGDLSSVQLNQICHDRSPKAA
jgi:hypothetical protein